MASVSLPAVCSANGVHTWLMFAPAAAKQASGISRCCHWPRAAARRAAVTATLPTQEAPQPMPTVTAALGDSSTL